MNRLKTLAQNFMREEEGAVVTEYGMLIVVLVLGLGVAIGLFREQLKTWFTNIGNNLSSLSSTT